METLSSQEAKQIQNAEVVVGEPSLTATKMQERAIHFEDARYEYIQKNKAEINQARNAVQQERTEQVKQRLIAVKEFMQEASTLSKFKEVTQQTKTKLMSSVANGSMWAKDRVEKAGTWANKHLAAYANDIAAIKGTAYPQQLSLVGLDGSTMVIANQASSQADDVVTDDVDFIDAEDEPEFEKIDVEAYGAPLAEAERANEQLVVQPQMDPVEKEQKIPRWLKAAAMTVVGVAIASVYMMNGPKSKKVAADFANKNDTTKVMSIAKNQAVVTKPILGEAVTPIMIKNELRPAKHKRHHAANKYAAVHYATVVNEAVETNDVHVAEAQTENLATRNVLSPAEADSLSYMNDQAYLESREATEDLVMVKPATPTIRQMARFLGNYFATHAVDVPKPDSVTAAKAEKSGFLQRVSNVFSKKEKVQAETKVETKIVSLSQAEYKEQIRKQKLDSLGKVWATGKDGSLDYTHAKQIIRDVEALGGKFDKRTNLIVDAKGTVEQPKQASAASVKQSVLQQQANQTQTEHVKTTVQATQAVPAPTPAAEKFVPMTQGGQERADTAARIEKIKQAVAEQKKSLWIDHKDHPLPQNKHDPAYKIIQQLNKIDEKVQHEDDKNGTPDRTSEAFQKLFDQHTDKEAELEKLQSQKTAALSSMQENAQDIKQVDPMNLINKFGRTPTYQRPKRMMRIYS